MKKLLILLILFNIGCSTRKFETNITQLKPEVPIVNTFNTVKSDTSFMFKREYIPMNSYYPPIIPKDNRAIKPINLTKKDTNDRIETPEERRKRYNSTASIFYYILIGITSYITFDYFKYK